MNRALLLLIATAAVGGGLAFFALQAPAPGPAQGMNEAPIQMSEDASPTKPAAPAEAKSASAAANLADIGDLPRAKVAATGGRAKAWEVIPINSVGQPVASAVIRAVPAPEVGRGIEPLEGVGRIKFEDVPSGTWTLTVTSEDFPTWSRDINVAADRTQRTPVSMGPELRVTGLVRDSNGAPLARNTPVFLLPKDATHPTQIQRRGKVRGNSKGLPGGAIAVQTDPKGRFEVRLPEAGEYRISIGEARQGDQARWTQKEPFELTYGGPDYVVGTVPARPELTLRFQGPKESRATSVSAYVYDSERAAQMARGAEKAKSKAPRMTREEAQKAAKLEALGYAEKIGATGVNGSGLGAGGRRGGAGRNGARTGRTRRAGGTGTARSAREENLRMQESDFGDIDPNLSDAVNRAPLFEPGWRSIGSRPVSAEGEAVFTDLPESEDVRFLFIRGQERITTLAPIRMRAKQRGIGATSLPAPSTEENPEPSNLASVMVSDRPADDEAPTFPVGVAWSIKER